MADSVSLTDLQTDEGLGTAPLTSSFKPSLQPAAPGGIQDVLGQVIDLVPKMKAMRSAAPEAAIRQNTAQISKLANEPTPPMPERAKLEPIPKEQPYQFRDTMEAFQSPAIALVMLGSLLTRAPMTAALNAGAAAMNGLHQGDMELYKQKREEWKDNLDRAIQQNNSEIEKYREALDERKTSISDKLAKINALAAANRDEQMLASIESGDISNAYRFVQTREAQAQRAQQLMLSDQNRKDQLAETVKRDEATNKRAADALAEAKRRTDLMAGKKSDAQVAKAKQKQDDLDVLTAQIDGVINTATASVGGWEGWLKEKSNQGPGQLIPWLNFEDRREFKAKMDLLQTTLQNRYLNSRYFSKGALEHMNELVPGLNADEPTSDTITALNNLRDVINQQVQDIKKGNVPVGPDEQQPAADGGAADMSDDDLKDAYRRALGF